MNAFKSFLAAIGRFFHIIPQLTDQQMADNTKISSLTQQLGDAQKAIVADKATIAQLTTDLATSRTNESNAVSVAQTATTAQQAAESQVTALTGQVAELTAQLAALPDPTALAANEDAQAAVIAATTATPAAG
jgi:uncharacterized protein involved in exopolysaccharide biosynthesis